eukprot:m.68451 g.68451  ORF g.68451 m.68451 type:complete len:229 (+) comp9921_c0_seq1:222-908(+)
MYGDEGAPGFKVLVVGDSGVGKSSVTHLICHGKSVLEPKYTVGCQVQIKLFQLPDELGVHCFEFWDISGSPRYAETRQVYFQSPDGIILVHDLANKKSHTNLRRWLTELRQVAPDVAGHSRQGSPAKHSTLDSIGDFDPEAALGGEGSGLPALVIGTRLDVVGTGAPVRCQLADDLGCRAVYINSRDQKTIHDDGQLARALQQFFHRMVEQRSRSGRTGRRQRVVSPR